jgi:hypothetical protein
MELFAISSFIILCHQRYKSICLEARVPIHEVADTEKELSHDLEAMLARHPYIPSFYCIFDYHGQVNEVLCHNSIR